MGSRPLGVTIAAIVLAVSGVFQVLIGTEALGMTSLGLGAAADAAGVSGWASIVSGALSIIVAGGLFTLQGWAWLLTVVVMAIRVVSDVFVVVTHGMSSTLGAAALGNLVISAVIVFYFTRPHVKAAFGR